MVSIRSISLAFLLLFGQVRIPGPGGGAPRGFNYTYVGGSVTACIIELSAQSTCSYAWHVNPTVGQLAVCQAFWQDSGATTAAMNGVNNGSFTALGSKVAGVGGDAGFSAQMFYKVITSGGADTVRFPLSASTTLGGWECALFNHSGGTPRLDGSPGFLYSTTPASGTTATIGPLSISNGQGILFGHLMGIATGTASAGTGFTSVNDTASCFWNGTTCQYTNGDWSGSGNVFEYKLNAATGNQTATFTVSSSGVDVTLGQAAF
jgi:hypothetical protein